MPTSSFSKTFIIKTGEAAEAIIKALESRQRGLTKPIPSSTCKEVSKELLARKSGLQ